MTFACQPVYTFGVKSYPEVSIEGGTMQACTLIVGERQFRLRVPCDVAELADRLTDAVRQGGAMVALPVTGEVQISVLISPGLCVVLETYEVDSPLAAASSAAMPWLAIDDLDF